MIYKIISQTEPVTITKQDGTQTQKSTVVLQELGGQYANSYAAVLLGNQVKFYPNELVAASLRFNARDYNGRSYQDVTINEIYKLTSNEPFRVKGTGT